METSILLYIILDWAGISLTPEEYYKQCKAGRLGTYVAMYRSITKQREETMDFKIKHETKQVVVSAYAPTETMKQAGISATNHGYQLVVSYGTPKHQVDTKCICHDCVQFGFTKHPVIQDGI